jgi:hypothetical protein
MNINYIMVGLMTLAVGLIVTNALYKPETPNPELPPFLVPVETGKTKKYVSMTRDAGMYTERARRTAIISNPSGIFGYKGSTNGSLEWNFLTSICVCPPRAIPCPAPEYIADGGNATSDVCDIIDGSGTEVLDFGDSTTNVCDV